MSTTTNPTKWAATAEVAPCVGNSLLGEAIGAYVPVLGRAPSVRAFRDGVERAMGALNFHLINLEEVRQIRSLEDVASLDEILRDRINLLDEGNLIEFGSFHSFTG